MYITDYLEIAMSDPNEEVIFGVTYLVCDGYPMDKETGVVDYEAEPEAINRLSIGFIFFNINIYWND